MTSVILAFEVIWVGAFLDRQPDNGISETDHVGTNPNSSFTSPTSLGFSTVSGMLVIAGDSGIDFLRFP